MTFLSKIDKAKKLIRKYLKMHGRCIVACSFGKDSMVLYHLCQSIKKDIPVFSVMTPFKPEVTLKYKKEIEKYYGMNLKTYCRIENMHVHEWWKSDPSKCCEYYKVSMTAEALQNYDIWFTGLRKSEGALRAQMESIILKDRFGKIKVNPILDFTEKDIWRYLSLYQIPPNPLYKEGYRSLGCAPCSVKETNENEPERQGRWQGTEKQGGECGIHSGNNNNSMNSQIKWNTFKKKPLIVDAFQITKEILASVPCYHELVKGVFSQGNHVIVNTLEGNMRGDIGDWIIKGIKGEVYPIKNNIFKDSYDQN